MMRLLLPICFSLVALFQGIVTMAQNELPRLMSHLEQGAFDSANAMFSPRVADMLSPEMLGQTWDQLQIGLGSYQHLDSIRISNKEGLVLQETLAHFETGALKVIATLAPDGLVGFRFFPLDYRLPAYGRSVSVGKLALEVSPNEQVSLEGELMLPKGCEQCPVVVLVHGSGPVDKDETIGPNKPFLDLALGLARHGIGTFRYDKRSHTYPASFKAPHSMQELAVEDAVTAVRLLKAQENLPLGPIVVAGHSLGGYALPRILQQLDDEVAGGIVLAGPSRGLDQLILEQVDYLAAMDDSVTQTERIQRQAAMERMVRIRSKNFTDSTPGIELMGNWPGLFWNDVAEYDPVSLAMEIGKPLLVLQGEKDCQVYQTDLERWRTAEESLPLKVVSYPKLNHLFMPIESEYSHPSEYQIPNNVDEQVILDMVDWINSLK